jgi:ABC-type sugar transport system permease subunit
LRAGRGLWSAWGFVAFPLAIVFVFTLLPTLVGVGLSFCEWSGGGTPRFIGWQNYREALADHALWPALRNTLVFALVFVPVTTLAAFLFAVALNARWFVGRTLVRTVFFLPTVVSIVAIGFIWRWVLEPSSAGLLNHVLDETVRVFGRLVGHSGTLHVDWPDWLGNNPWGLATIIVVSIWRGLGFAVVLYLAALGSVPRAHYDAAAVDGAGAWQSIWHITWPGVRPTTFFLLITGMIGALQVFDIVLVMVGAIEQPWTDVLNLYLYREFGHNRLGYAATLGVIVLALTVIVTVAQLLWLRSSREASA